MSTNAELHQRRLAAVPRGVANSLPVYAERASNAELWDVEGKRYVDFASGIAVLNTGHRHPTVIKAISAQLERLMHTCFQVTPYASYIELCEQLKLAPDRPQRNRCCFDRRGGGGKRPQGGSLSHQAFRRHCLQRQLSRPHPGGYDFDRQGPAV
jgi:4-aminobutyrate aminotransferase-like enzyme